MSGDLAHPPRDYSTYQRFKDVIWYWLGMGYRPFIAAGLVVTAVAVAASVALLVAFSQAQRAAQDASGMSADTPTAVFAPTMLTVLGCLRVSCPDAPQQAELLASRSSGVPIDVVVAGTVTARVTPGVADTHQWQRFADAATMSGQVDGAGVVDTLHADGDVARFTVPGTPWHGAMTFSRSSDGLRLTRIEYSQGMPS